MKTISEYEAENEALRKQNEDLKQKLTKALQAIATEHDRVMENLKKASE